MFFTMLIMYSAFVLTSVHTNYYEQGVGKIFEYYVYIWTFGDFIEEGISCFVSIGIFMTIYFGKKILVLEGFYNYSSQFKSYDFPLKQGTEFFFGSFYFKMFAVQVSEFSALVPIFLGKFCNVT